MDFNDKDEWLTKEDIERWNNLQDPKPIPLNGEEEMI